MKFGITPWDHEHIHAADSRFWLDPEIGWLPQ